METWKDIPGYGGLYEVSSHGRVRSAPRPTTAGGLLRPAIASNGYPVVNLCKDGQPHQRPVHALVTAAFLGPCPAGMVVDHVNGDKEDNYLGNLRYIDSFANSTRGGKTVAGTADGKEVARLESAACLARVLGVQPAFVWRRLKRKNFTINGITWNYVSTARGSAIRTQ